MQQPATEQMRNVVLLSHSGAGKTSLSETMLFNTGAITRLGKVEQGNTTSDYDPDETKRSISIYLSMIPCEWRGFKVNVIDTPGYADFVAEVKSGVRVADGAVIVVCAASGVEVGTELGWSYAEEQETPRLIFVNKMDRENADFFRVVDEIKSRLGGKCVPIEIPVGSQSDFNGVVDLVRMKSYTGPQMQEGDIPGELRERAEESREKLVEAVAETDDNLINKYLEGEELTEEEIVQGLRAGVGAGQVVPILVGSAQQNLGVNRLLDAMCDYLPSPADRGPVTAVNLATKEEEGLQADAAGPLAALVFKTSADPYVGKLTYLRVYSGTIHSDSTVWNGGKERQERIGQLYMLRGKNQEPVPHVIAGDIGAVAKLAETTTGDTLCGRDRPLALPGIEFPAPVISVAVHPKTKADLDKLGSSLARLVEEDPSLQVRRDGNTMETILSGVGDSQLEVAAEKMLRKFGVDVKLETPKVPYRESIAASTKMEYKHKKQTGGHGQYGHVFLELEPKVRGEGYEFAERVVGGVVPRNYIPSVEKGVVEALQEGVLAGYPVVDVKVTLYDGSYHSVDSSDIAFKIAASHATRKGLAEAQPVLLEPVVNMKITVPESYTGDIISDLNGKRAKVLGMNPAGGMNVIEAQAPLAE
ncbi:MAG: elongation factor G, partial [Chloroflexota bacterium]|nr:elongation factor G [Chloroflexota bacterium]